MERRPSLAASAAATYTTNLAVAALSLVNVLIVARALGPEGRGEVAFLTTVGVLTSNLAALGIQEANANIGSSHPALRRALAGNSAALAAILGVGAAAAVLGLVALVPAAGGGADPTLLVLVLASLPVLLLKIYLTFLLQADYRFTVTNLAWLVPAALNAAANAALAAVGLLTVTAAVVIWIAGQGLSLALLLLYLVLRRAGFGRPEPALARRMLGFGAQTHIGRALTLGNYRLDQWLLGALAGPGALGLYSVAVAWAEMLFFLPTALVSVQRPDLVRAGAKDAGTLAATTFRVSVLMTLPLVVVLVVGAPLLCVTVFGEDFRGSIDDLRVLAFGAFGMAALKLLGNALTAQRKPLLATAGVAIALAVGVALDIALIPSFEGLGAAVAATIAYSVGGVAIAIVFARTLGEPLRHLVPRGGDVPWLWRRARRALGRPGMESAP